MTWDQIVTWLVMPAIVAAVVGFGGLWLASRDSPPRDHGNPAE